MFIPIFNLVYYVVIALGGPSGSSVPLCGSKSLLNLRLAGVQVAWSACHDHILENRFVPNWIRGKGEDPAGGAGDLNRS